MYIGKSLKYILLIVFFKKMAVKSTSRKVHVYVFVYVYVVPHQKFNVVEYIVMVICQLQN